MAKVKLGKVFLNARNSAIGVSHRDSGDASFYWKGRLREIYGEYLKGNIVADPLNSSEQQAKDYLLSLLDPKKDLVLFDLLKEIENGKKSFIFTDEVKRYSKLVNHYKDPLLVNLMIEHSAKLLEENQLIFDLELSKFTKKLYSSFRKLVKSKQLSEHARLLLASIFLDYIKLELPS